MEFSSLGYLPSDEGIPARADALMREARARRASDDAGHAGPRVVTTGRKNVTAEAVCTGMDLDTGESVEWHATGKGFAVTRHMRIEDKAPEKAAIVDALAFSLVPPDERSYTWVLDQVSQFLPIHELKLKRGCFGFTHSAHFDGGLIAWGGESQRGRVYFSLMGKGCSMVCDWAQVAQWLEQHRATIKRCDLAHDDFDGKRVSIDWAVSQYQAEGFNAGGRRPKHQVFGDWLDGAASVGGRTLAIGNRASGKYTRIYEKGKQLGDAASCWTRVEVEWRAQDRHIPYDILTRPGHYLAGAYPCLAFIESEQSVIKTVSKAARIAFDAAVEHAKQQCGKLVNLMLTVAGGDYIDVVQQLVRPGIPARIDPYSYHVARAPSMLDRTLQGAV